MAKLNVEIKPNGDIRYWLDFAGKTFETTEKWDGPDEGTDLNMQVETSMLTVLIGILGEFDAEEVLELICEIDKVSTISTIQEIIVALTEYEAKLKEDAEP